MPMILDRGGCWTVDEKMGQTYVWYEQANTLASRDFKQPQAVMQTLVFDESQITSRQNGNHPTWGGCAIPYTETQTERW